MINTLRTPKGQNPHFFDDPNVDRLMSMVMELAQEVSVLRERLDSHERVSESKGGFGVSDIEAYDPDDDVLSARDAWRSAFLDRLLAPVQAEYTEAANRKRG